MSATTDEAIRQPVEMRRADELAARRINDHWPRPPWWLLSPRAVKPFVVGSDEPLPVPGGSPVTITPTFDGNR